jgi:hypothetical protein
MTWGIDGLPPYDSNCTKISIDLTRVKNALLSSPRACYPKILHPRPLRARPSLAMGLFGSKASAR